MKKNEKIENSNDSKFYEQCVEKELGTLVQETILNGGKEDVVIGKDVITIKEDNIDITKYYYYVVVEFMNLDESQNEDMNRTLVGNVKVELTTPFEEQVTIIEQNVEYILTNATEGQIIEDDGTIDHNLRYIGNNPNNYVTFNNELWRIIGVMNNVNDGSGNIETRIKIRTATALNGGGYVSNFAWDSSTPDVNYGYGINEWSQADLMKLLNPGYEAEEIGGSLYWNSQQGTYYYGINNAKGSCDFRNTGLTDDAKKMIGKAVWYTGSNDGVEYTENNILTSQFYEIERSGYAQKNCTDENYCNDTVERSSTWTGYIGLIYPSDYGYATSGGTYNTRDACLNKELYNWTTNTGCYSWLLYSASQYTITPSSIKSNVFTISSTGIVMTENTSSSHRPLTYPTLYLKSNVKIVKGTGEKNTPFELSLE